MASNNEYEHKGEWDRKCDKLLSDVVRDRRAKGLDSGINGSFVIVDGELVFGGMLRDGVEVSSDFEILMVLRRILGLRIDNFERDNQKRFVPDGREGYKLPDYERENEEYARMLNEKYGSSGDSSSAGKVGDGNEG